MIILKVISTIILIGFIFFFGFGLSQEMKAKQKGEDSTMLTTTAIMLICFVFILLINAHLNFDSLYKTEVIGLKPFNLSILGILSLTNL